jgi:aryl-alcohol dehydrogenase-like predicted oxidoreductase
VRKAVEASLRRLQTDWIDLYQLHTPDRVTPIEETLDVLDDLIAEGKVRYIGHSNLAGWQIADAEYQAVLHGHPRFVSAQNEYNLLRRGVEAEVLPAVNRYGLGFLPFFPLHNGLFTGKFSRSGGPDDSRIMRQRRHILDEAPWDALDAYQRFCDDRGITMLQATYGWLLAQPGLTSVIAGATRPDQVVANAEAGTAWRPSADEVAEVSALFPL